MRFNNESGPYMVFILAQHTLNFGYLQLCFMKVTSSNTELFEMIVGVLTTYHTKYT